MGKGFSQKTKRQAFVYFRISAKQSPRDERAKPGAQRSGAPGLMPSRIKASERSERVLRLPRVFPFHRLRFRLWVGVGKVLRTTERLLLAHPRQVQNRCGCDLERSDRRLAFIALIRKALRGFEHLSSLFTVPFLGDDTKLQRVASPAKLMSGGTRRNSLKERRTTSPRYP